MGRVSIAKLKKFQEEATAFLTERDIASIDQVKQSQAWKFAHFCLLVFKSFGRNRCPLRASALAYTTLLALIPVLAVVVSVSTSFLRKDGVKPVNYLVTYVVTQVAPQLNLIPKGTDAEAAASQQAVADRILGYINNVDSGTLGVTAVIGLIFVAISLLATIEATFNDIWGVSRGRPWISRIVQYWATITLGPLVIVTAVALSIGTHFASTQAWLAKSPFLNALVTKDFLPLVLLTGAFTVFYRQMPNTRVRWKAAFIGGLVGGCLWQLNNMFYAVNLSRVLTYSKIYGSLGALPIFLVGLYFSWLIVLLGAQVAYAFQNREAYVQEKQAESVNQRGREFIALRLMALVGQQFKSRLPVPTRLGIATALAVPSQIICDILKDLVRSRLLVEVLGDETGYAPSRPLEDISADDILVAMRAGTGQELATKDDPMRLVVRQAFERILLAEKGIAGAVTLDALAAKAVEVSPSKLPAGTN